MATRRRELERLTVQYPEQFIGHKVIPTITRRWRSGKIWYRTIIPDASAVKGRAKGAVLGKVLISDTHFDYNTVSKNSVMPCLVSYPITGMVLKQDVDRQLIEQGQDQPSVQSSDQWKEKELS